MTTKPFAYQETAIRRIEKFDGRALLAMDPGLGKSATSLWWWHRYVGEGPVIIVCPASIKYNWQRECLLHIKTHATILDSTTPDWNTPVNHDIYILNFNILIRRRGDKAGEGWLAFLKHLKPKLVIIDECQALRNPRSKQTRSVVQLCRKVPYVLALSGTPLVNRPAELWPTLNLLCPEQYESFWSFGMSYCKPRRTPWGWKYDGATNLNQLNMELNRNCMIRYRKSEVLKDLPAKSRFITPMPLDKPKEYEKAQKDFISWLVRINKSKARKALKAKKLAQFNYLRMLCGELKIGSVSDWIHNYLEETDEKLLLFAVHRKVVKTLHDKFRKVSVVVDGSTSKKQRQENFDTFTGNSNCRMLIGNVQAAGVGWNARGVSTVAFAELPWTPGEVTQAEDRSHGIGRGVKGVATQVYFLVAHGTMETKLCRILQSKQKILDTTLDGGEQDDSLNIMDLLEESLLEEMRQ